MALSLGCACGARFEVDETFAGQTVQCPDCNEAVPVPVRLRGPLRTSGWAIASMVSALVLAFTGVGTVLAVVFGVIALVRISRQRNELAGVGYAVFGITAGVIFTGLFAFAVSQGELFGIGDELRERLHGHNVDLSGPLEIERPEDGFAITRPSERWGVARGSLEDELTSEYSILALAYLAKNSYVVINREPSFGESLEEHSQNLIESIRNGPTDPEEAGARRIFITNVRVQQSRRLPTANGLETLEVQLNTREQGYTVRYLIRLVRNVNDPNKVYVLWSWTFDRLYTEMEPELRNALDSFRLLEK